MRRTWSAALVVAAVVLVAGERFSRADEKSLAECIQACPAHGDEDRLTCLLHCTGFLSGGGDGSAASGGAGSGGGSGGGGLPGPTPCGCGACVLGPNRVPVCCNGRVCGETCCLAGSACANDALGGQICCTSGVSCSGTCCPFGSTGCASGKCYCASGLICSGECCVAGQVCGPNGGCCYPRSVCNGICCPGGAVCVVQAKQPGGASVGSCCPAERACGARCCPQGQACAGNVCCSAERACGSTCCAPGLICTSGQCCAPRAICVGRGPPVDPGGAPRLYPYCCPGGETCDRKSLKCVCVGGVCGNPLK
jgi:hypothetical protein